MMPFLKKLHKWVGLLIGIQVMLWLLSGLMISLLDPIKVNGQYWSAHVIDEQKPFNRDDLLEPRELAPEHLHGALGIRLAHSQGLPVYQIKHADGETLLDAVNGSVIVFDRAEAEEIARQDYTGSGRIVTAKAGMAPDMETRNHAGQYWKVDFSDDIGTSIYVSTASGKILERRNSYWRIRDFFWMLHIMDYPQHENFNNSLIITVALVAAWLGISGFILLFGSFNRHDFDFLNIIKRKNMATITWLDPVSGSSGQVDLRKGSNLFLSLATHGVELPSVCGGGGECGKCRVKIDAVKLRVANSIEKGLIPRPMREKGFRLACQMEVADNLELELSRGSRVKTKNTHDKPA